MLNLRAAKLVYYDTLQRDLRSARTLLYVRERTLMAQPFDAGKIETTGDAIPIAEQVDPAPGVISQNLFSVSRNGLLAYISGGLGSGWQRTWFDRSGKATGTLGGAGQ